MLFFFLLLFLCVVCEVCVCLGGVEGSKGRGTCLSSAQNKQTLLIRQKASPQKKEKATHLLLALDHLGNRRFLVLGQAFNNQVPKADFEAAQKVGITLSLDHRLGLRDL